MDVLFRWLNWLSLTVIQKTKEQFESMSIEARNAYASTLCEMMGGDIVPLDVLSTPFTFSLRRYEIRMRLLPKGVFNMGLSPAEERAARAIQEPLPLNLHEMRPVRKTRVESFLISEAPLSIRVLRDLLGRRTSKYISGTVEEMPAYVRRAHAVESADLLGCHLPTERQWEYACRAASPTLFVWGDELISSSELEGWLDYTQIATAKANNFGLKWLFVSEWCSDLFRESHAIDAPVSKNFVVRGGGSDFWPWQDAGEWVWCLPSMRIPSTDLVNGTSAFRIARRIEWD